MSLPPCKWRGAAGAAGRYPCSHPALVTPAAGVSEAACRGCRVADKDPGPKLLALIAARRGGLPGTELKALIASLGVEPAGCGCDGFAAKMDRWGVEGCRHRMAEIAERLRGQAERLGWREKLKAGALALANGLPLTIEGLVEEAIRRAEEKANQLAS